MFAEIDGFASAQSFSDIHKQLFVYFVLMNLGLKICPQFQWELTVTEQNEQMI
jgi:hypothetical protein